VIVQGPDGRPSFNALRGELAKRRPRELIFMAFDLLHINDRDIRSEPVEDRRARLRALIGDHAEGRPFQFSDHVSGGGPEFFAAAEAMGLEGIISKKMGSRYRSGPAKSWVKTKSFTESELVVIGTSKGDLAPVALLARETDDHRLEYVGGAMVTFSEADRERFWRANERLKTATPALHMDPRPETSWLKPEMRVRVRHLSGEEMLRHATVKALSYVPPEQTSRSAGKGPRIGGKPGSEPSFHVEQGSVPDRDALTAYYRAVAPVLLPLLSNRPLNLFRCRGRHCFFQRNRNHPPTEQDFTAPIRTMPILQKYGRTEDYLFVDSVDGLLACVEAGAVEFHAWGSRVPDYEKPDRIAFDLDPGEGIGFTAVKEAAFQLRESLGALGLRSWPLLTGGKGVHVVVPFTQDQPWPSVRSFARNFCAALADAAPDRYTIALPMQKRRGRIFLDFLRNQRTATAIMPYSLRARPGSPVAAPVSWAELPTIESARGFTIMDAQALVRRANSAALRKWGAARQRLPIL
jgi:bifunctional non-homologous end joining protein LigD